VGVKSKLGKIGILVGANLDESISAFYSSEFFMAVVSPDYLIEITVMKRNFKSP
jgi:hypothetical protein